MCLKFAGQLQFKITHCVTTFFYEQRDEIQNILSRSKKMPSANNLKITELIKLGQANHIL